jgi:hypothetical protein
MHEPRLLRKDFRHSFSRKSKELVERYPTVSTRVCGTAHSQSQEVGKRSMFLSIAD